VFSILADREMPRLLDRGVGSKVDYYAEHMDAGRLPDPQYQISFRNLLELKYRGVRFDVVIAAHQLAVDFLRAFRAELFPDTPVVYLTEDRGVSRMPDSTGVVAERDYPRTLALALQLQPDTSRVFVVSGSSARDRVNEQDARQQFASLSPRLNFTYLAGLTSQETEQQLATLPPHSIVFYLIFYQDAAGVNVLPAEYFQRVAAVSNRPVYSWVDWTLGRGAVGGSVLSTDGEV